MSLFTSYTGARPVPLNSCFDGSLHSGNSRCCGFVESKKFRFLRTMQCCIAIARTHLIGEGINRTVHGTSS